MIDGFDAVDDGAAHEGDLALIFGDFFVGVDAVGGHGEIEFYDIARLPVSGDLEVPILQSAGGERLAVDFDGEGRDGGGIGEAVEIGRNGKLGMRRAREKWRFFSVETVNLTCPDQG